MGHHSTAAARIVTVVVLAGCCVTGISDDTDQQRSSKLQDSFADLLQPMFQQHCVKCHGANGDVDGDVDLLRLQGIEDLQQTPELIGNLIEVLDSGYMPPEEEPVLAPDWRIRAVGALRQQLRMVVHDRPSVKPAPLRRMNRFQYNNAIMDLFQLNVVVFPLPERMLREHGGYFQPHAGKMPDQLKVGSRPLGKSQLIERRLAGVTPFPQDLRAEHGFDNRGDHLTLSPILLESFLRLSRSIVESADFNEQTCGIWSEFFSPPREENIEKAVVVEQRLRDFLTRAFRRGVEEELLDRYVGYALSQMDDGESFVDAMKATAAAAIASPRFLYIYDVIDSDAPSQGAADYNLASRLAFFLWGSIPDQVLLDVAASGKLHHRDILSQQLDRMLRDRKLKRFCDSFPAQWLQLERIISSTPDPQRYPQFYFAKYRASMHMMLEPLLLFETILIEDQSILKLIDSDFSYRSALLESWYRDGTQGNAGPPTRISFRRVPVPDRREGGVITNAAVMTMTSGTTRTKPMTRGAWLASVILNDPPEPPPADVPPLAEKPGAGEQDLSLRERFVLHRKQAACAGCHQRIDPLGFALENYDAAGIWRDYYANGRPVDSSGTLFGRYEFRSIIEFKDALLSEKDHFARAFAAHLLSFALGRQIVVEDSPSLDQIVRRTAEADYRFQSLIKQIVLSDPFMN